MSYLALILVVIGLSGLCWALHPILYICRHERALAWGWKALAGMVGMFILGYTIFAIHLITSKNQGFTEILLSIILCGGGGFVVLVSYMSRSTLDKMERIAASFEQQALHDNLTGLPNRTALFVTLDKRLAYRELSQDPVAVMLMDLNGFKEINDTLGHQAGDLALQTIAPRFQNQLRSADTLCRLGGDEFAVILPQTDKTQALSAARKLLDACSYPIVIGGQPMQIGVSIGIAACPEDAQASERLMQFADVAMYEAKRQRTGVEVYHEGIDQHSPEKLLEPNLLKHAIHACDIQVKFQPVLDREQRVIALEAHHGWTTPANREHNQEYMMALAEKAGVVEELTRYFMETALVAFQRVMQSGEAQGELKLYLPLFHPSLNLDNLQALIEASANDTGIGRGKLVLMLSEVSMGQEYREYHQRIIALSRQGFGIGLCHFGVTGGSILLLQSLPLGVIKSDPAFCTQLAGHRGNIKILEAAVALLKELEIALIIDGVSDTRILDLIRHFHFDGVQGEGVAHALPWQQIGRWLDDHKANQTS